MITPRRFLIIIFVFVISSNIYSQRKLDFSGYKWSVKDSKGSQTGPGNNYFSSDAENIYLNNKNELVLKIIKKENKYLCSEIISENSFGYGKYLFEIESLPLIMNKSLVLGFFTYSDKPTETIFNEIDIEISKWGNFFNQRLQYVLHNRKNSFPLKRDDIRGLRKSTHCFEWYPDSIIFKSYDTNYENTDFSKPDEIFFIKNDNIPQPANEKVRINLWLTGRKKIIGKKVKVVIGKFLFIPLEK